MASYFYTVKFMTTIYRWLLCAYPTARQALRLLIPCFSIAISNTALSRLRSVTNCLSGCSLSLIVDRFGGQTIFAEPLPLLTQL